MTKEEITERLKAVRQFSGQSQEAFSAPLSVKRAMYAKIETGVSHLRLDVATEICAALGITMDEFLGWACENTSQDGEG